MAVEQPPAKFKVGLVQMAMSADPDVNLRRAVAKVAQAAAAGAQLVCLPELFRSQYFAQREDPNCSILASPSPGRVPRRPAPPGNRAPAAGSRPCSSVRPRGSVTTSPP